MSNFQSQSTWADLLREIPFTPSPNSEIFLEELRRELDRERAAWTPRQRRAHALRRPYYRARWWFEENVAWRFARERPDNDY